MTSGEGRKFDLTVAIAQFELGQDTYTVTPPVIKRGAGMPISRDASSIAFCAVLNDPSGGRLNEIVAATNPLWWFT